MEEISMHFANLHLHSTYSDAGFTPEQLVLIGKSLGYGALALTDHETDGGCTEFMRVAEQEGIKSITGAEFYGDADGHAVHLTALDFDRNDPDLRGYITKRCKLYAERTRKCVEFGIEKGILQGITWDDVLYYAGEGAWICIDTVFYALRMKKAIPEQGLSYVRTNVFKAPEMLALMPKHPAAEDVIRIVRKAGGVIALAHPASGMPQYIEKLVDYGLNGIEICHPSVSPEMTKLAQEAAQKYNLYHCGGTDHTGPMSCCGGKYAIPAFHGISEENFDILVERRLG